MFLSKSSFQYTRRLSFQNIRFVSNDNRLHPLSKSINFFNLEGYAKIDHVLTPDEVKIYSDIYNKILSGEIDPGNRRNDLGSHADRKTTVENITQVMWPSDLVPGIHEMPLHKKTSDIAKALLGSDMEFDFDMLINKLTDTATPWHQDAAYWISGFTDSRALSFWVSLDMATVDNGCMWFVPGSHLESIRLHIQAGKGGGALYTKDCSESEGVCIPLNPGSATVHHGHTLHYTRGNKIGTSRRAYIINYRPKKMIEYERSKGFDHGRTDIAKTKNQVFAEKKLTVGGGV